MRSVSENYLRVAVLVLIAFFTAIASVGPAGAEEFTMQKNLDGIAAQLARWSKQSSMGQLTPQAQQKLGQLLLETSKLLKEMGMKSGPEMSMDHNKEIEMMKKEWDPFDTADRM